MAVLKLSLLELSINTNNYRYPLADFKQICDMLSGLTKDNSGRWFEIIGNDTEYIYLKSTEINCLGKSTCGGCDPSCPVNLQGS